MSRTPGLVAAVLTGVWVAGCAGGGPPRIEVTGGVAGGESAPAASQAGEGGAPPAIVSPGDLVTAHYRIRNTGGRDLLLHGVALACGCRLASSLPDALAPGEDAPVTVRCRAPRTRGDAAREIRLFSSDPARPEKRLRVPVRVAAASAAEPPALYFGYVAVGGSAERELVVPALDEANHAPASAELPAAGAAAAALPVAGDPALTVEPRPPRADGRRVYLIRFAPRAPGVVRTTVTLAPGDEVPVIGVGFGTLVAFPAEAMPASATPAGGASVITLKAVSEDPLEITRVELPPGLAGDLVATTPGREWRLALRARGPQASEAPPIRIHTSAAADPVLEIPVRPADTP